jgi:hypothetical protein
MSFLSPWLLFGLLTAALPILIHLLNRKEPKIVPFAAIEFLRRAYQKNAKKIKLKQFLLILLRTLIILFIVLSLARPFFQPQGLGQSKAISQLKADSAVLLIDQSYQMGFDLLASPHEELSLFEHAKGQALAMLDEQSHPMALVLAGTELKVPVAEASADYASLREGLSKAKLEPVTAKLELGILEALQILKKRPEHEKRQILVFTTPYQGQRLANQFQSALEGVELIFVDLSDALAQENGFGNHGISKILLSPAPQRGANHWKLEATIWNWGEKAVNGLAVWVEIAGKIKVKSLVDIPSHGSIQQKFYFHVEEEIKNNGLEGLLKLADDPLKIDNQASFLIEPQQKIKILAINGDPRPIPREDELFFIEKALAPKVSNGQAFELDIRNGDEFTGINQSELQAYQVVFIANLSTPHLAFGKELEAYIKKGGGVFLTVGERTNIEAWNQAFEGFLPKPLRERKIAGDAAQSMEDRKLAYFDKYKENHAIFSFLKNAFGNLKLSSLGQTQIKEYMLFDPVTNDLSKSLIDLNEGVPILIERSMEQGRAVIYGSTIDLQWGDLALKPDFVPLIQHLFKGLAQSKQNQQILQGFYGQSIQFDFSQKGPFYVINPLKEKLPLAAHLKFDRTQKLGYYFVQDATGQTLSKFQIIIDSSQGQLIAEVKPEQAENQEKSNRQSVAQLTPKKELWHISLLLIFFLLLGEALLIYQRKNRV